MHDAGTLRLCFFGDGNHVHVQRWLDAFVRRGHDVHLFSDTPVSLPGVTVHDISVPVPVKGARFLARLLKIRRMLARLAPDVLHAHCMANAGHWAALTGYHPFVLTVWGSDIFLYPHFSRRNMLLTRRTLRRADLVTGDSRALIDKAVALGANPAHSHMIHWGVDTTLFYPADRAAARRELGLDEAPTIIFIRNLFKMHNVDVLLRAFARLRGTRPDARLVIKATGPEEQPLRSLAAELGLDGAVRFVGQTPYAQVARYLQAADVFVSIPSSDSAPVSLLEALACGLPVIVSDLPAYHEWLREGIDGQIVPVRDEQRLAEALGRSLPPAEGYRTEPAQAHRDLPPLSQEYHMDRMESLYRSLVQQRAARKQ